LLTSGITAKERTINKIIAAFYRDDIEFQTTVSVKIDAEQPLPVRFVPFCEKLHWLSNKKLFCMGK